jgi:tetratricopeptide (TPR) repeat protein
MSEAPQPTGAVEIFFSYAHEDAELCGRLQQHFSFLRRERKITQWYDGEIKAGEEWRGEIEGRLDSADVILLLISAAFAHSDFCYNIETGRAMERHNAGEAVVVPIILHPCDWRSAPFARLQALPGSDEAISEWPNIEKALYEVARGVREVVEDLTARRAVKPPNAVQPHTREEIAAMPAHLPPPPAIDFVPRKDREGQDIVERLKRELTRDPKRLLVLWGEGGVGKTTLAAESARALSGVFGERVVWASAEKIADFTFSTLLDEIAVRLGDTELTKLAAGAKEQAVTRLISAAPTLVVLDNFETVSHDERSTCADFLATRAQCPVLITTRERVPHDAARHIHVDSMDDEEARQFVERWVGQEVHDPRAFEGLNRDEIIRAADARPYVLQWVLAQINLALEPRAVLDELARAEGEVGERVFRRSFELPQLGEDGRDTLLALSLFTPSASRPALAEVAGFGDDLKRLNEAVKRLAALHLLEAVSGGQRLTVQGLTRSLAQSHLSADERAAEFRGRHVAYFLRHAQAHQREAPEDLDALEAEKDNVLAALDATFDAQDWEGMLRIRSALDRLLYLRGYWSEAIRTGGQAEAAARELGLEQVVANCKTSVGMIYKERRDDEEAMRFYQEALEIFRRVGDDSGASLCLHQMAGIALSQVDYEEARRLNGESLEIKKRLGDEEGVAATLLQLGTLAHHEGDFEEAERLYTESLEILKRTGNQRFASISLNQLGRLAWSRGDLEKARRLYNESLEIKKRLGDQMGIAHTLYNLGRLAEKENKRAEAAAMFREVLTILEKLGSPEAEHVRRELRLVEDESVDISNEVSILLKALDRGKNARANSSKDEGESD